MTRPADADQPVPEQIREVIEQSDWPELSITEIVDRTGLSTDQVRGAAGSMDRLELDRTVGAVRLPEDSGGEFVDDHERELRTDGGRDAAIVRRLQRGHAAAVQVDARMRAVMMQKLLENPKQAAVGLAVRALAGGGSGA